MKRLVRNVIIFILVILSCNNVMAEEYEGTYTGEHGAQGKVMITIDFDENTVLGSTDGTIYDDKDEVKGKLTGTYDTNSQRIRGIITGKIIDPSGNENTTRNLSGTFTGKLSENKISGSWSCGDGFYNGTYRAQLRSESSLGLIVLEGMAYINDKIGNLTESYLYGNKDKLSLKTEEKSAVLAIIPGFAIFFGENTSVKINQEEITNNGEKQQITKINGSSINAILVELQKHIEENDIKKEMEEYEKKLSPMEKKERDKMFKRLNDLIPPAVMDMEIHKPRARTSVDFNMKNFEPILIGGGSYKPSYYDLACSGLPCGLLASKDVAEPGKCYVFAENGITKIYVIKGNWSVSDEDGKNTVIMKPGEMTFYLQNSAPAKPQAFKPGEPEKIFETQTTEGTLVVDPPVTFDVEQGFNAPNITSVQNGQKVTFPIEIKGHTKPYATVELTYEYQINVFNVLPVKGVVGTKRISADEKGYFYDKYTSVFGSGTQHTITATAIDSSGNKSPQTIIIITEQ